MVGVRSQKLVPGPYLVVPDTVEAMAFYASVFGAVELWRECLLDGWVLHAELAVGRHRLTLSGWSDTPLNDERGSLVPTYECEDPEAVVTRAVSAGAEVGADTVDGPLEGMVIRDPFGQHWVVTGMA